MQIGPAKAPTMQGGITAAEVGFCFTTSGAACADDAFPLSFTPWARVLLSHIGNMKNGVSLSQVKAALWWRGRPAGGGSGG